MSDVLTVAGGSTGPASDVSGVVKVGSDADFLYYNVELHTVTGSVRVCVCLARALLNVKRLLKWIVGEMSFLQFLQMGGRICTTIWSATHRAVVRVCASARG